MIGGSSFLIEQNMFDLTHTKKLSSVQFISAIFNVA